ncbi:MAG: hypothetical protein H7A51_15605 [Akkermansiaceae bacterium]|nr:hypothetical protein [Akkermansiaceae bacterium]
MHFTPPNTCINIFRGQSLGVRRAIAALARPCTSIAEGALLGESTFHDGAYITGDPKAAIARRTPKATNHFSLISNHCCMVSAGGILDSLTSKTSFPTSSDGLVIEKLPAKAALYLEIE